MAMRDYEELVERLKTCAELHGECSLCIYQGNPCDCMPETPLENAADVIEELVSNADKFKWVSAEERLPEEDGKYIVHIRDIEEGREICGVSCVDASYITTAFFDKSQMIWKEYDDIDCSCYNAALSATGTKHRAYISHWMFMPEWPKEVLG